MNDIDPKRLEKPEQDPTPEQFDDIYKTLVTYAETGAVQARTYSDDVTEGDEKAKVFTVPVIDQAVSLFRVPQEIRMKNPTNFEVTFTTPYRLEEDDTPEVAVDFTFEYDDGKMADYLLRGVVPEDSEGDFEWSGSYSQEESNDFEVENISHRLTKDDLTRLATIVAAATQLKR